MVKTNAAELAKFFKKFPEKIEKAFDKGAYLGMSVFLGKFTREQLSGRRGNLGLKRITGSLANSYKVTREDKVIRLSSISPYAHVHEHALGFNGYIYPRVKKFLMFKTKEGTFVMTKKVYIPKRTDLYGLWKKEGYTLVMKGFAKEVGKIIHGTK